MSHEEEDSQWISIPCRSKFRHKDAEEGVSGVQ